MSKQFFTLGVLMILAISAWSQNVIDRHFQAYQSQDNFTNIHVTAKMFELASYIELEDADEEVGEFLDFIKTVNTFDMIVGQDIEQSEKKYLTAIGKVDGEFDELLTVDDQEGNFSFFINESKGVVHELVMVGRGKTELMIFSLTGNMDLRQLSKMAQMIQTEQYRQMSKLSTHKVGEVNVYPNPARINSQISIDLPEEMIGGDAILYNVSGATVRQISINGMKQGLKTNGLSSGMHILELRKNGVSIKKKVMIQ